MIKIHRRRINEKVYIEFGVVPKYPDKSDWLDLRIMDEHLRREVKKIRPETLFNKESFLAEIKKILKEVKPRVLGEITSGDIDFSLYDIDVYYKKESNEKINLP